MRQYNKIDPMDIPDPGKIDRHGISIDAPTPTQVNIPDPWAPAGNGEPPTPPGGVPAGDPPVGDS